MNFEIEKKTTKIVIIQTQIKDHIGNKHARSHQDSSNVKTRKGICSIAIMFLMKMVSVMPYKILIIV